MKRLLALLIFMAVVQISFATDWAWYYIYVQTEYVQGPWTRTEVLDRSGSYNYLHPKQFEELFGSEREDLANAILNHLQKETPERYKFKCSLSLLSDTVLIQTKDSIKDFDAVKNELTASFTLNNFKAVKIIERNKTDLFELKDVSVPYMDLVPPAQTETPIVQKENAVPMDTLASEKPLKPFTNEEPGSTINIWLIISVIANIVLIVLLIRKRKI